MARTTFLRQVLILDRRRPPANPGIESLPQLNSTSALNTWQFTQAQGVAPAGTTKVEFFALFVDQSAGTGYFDDLAATQVPEPSSLALVGIASVAGAGETFPSAACAIVQLFEGD